MNQSHRFYDISDLPDQKIDDHTTKMAQLITNVYVMIWHIFVHLLFVVVFNFIRHNDIL